MEKIIILCQTANLKRMPHHIFPYGLTKFLNKMGYSAIMAGVDDAAYINQFGISSNITEAKIIDFYTKVFRIRKLRMINNILIKKGIIKLFSKYKPDITICIAIYPNYPYPNIFKEIKRFSKIIFWSVDDPIYFTESWFDSASHADFVLTNSYGSVEDYKKHGIENVAFLPPACDPEVFKPLGLNKKIEILYTGYAGFRRIGFENMLKPVINKFKKRVVIAGLGWEKISWARDATIIPFVERENLNKLYNMSKIVINIHHDKYYSRKGSFNYRNFEIPGSGAFQLCNDFEGIELCYKPKEEIVTSKNPKETIELVNYYLSNPEEREKIAYNSYLRAINHHTIQKRIEQLLYLIKNKI